MSDPAWSADLTALLDRAWSIWARGVADGAAPARLPALATMGAEGPTARIVALRGAERREGRLNVHTDTASAKIAELAADPRASLLVWDAADQVQLRARVTVQTLTGAAAEPAWARVPEAARHSYGKLPAPGTPLPGPDAHRTRPAQARFAVLACRIEAIDVVFLGELHRRARYTRSGGWIGQWLSP